MTTPQNAVSKRPVRPRDCVMLFGVPTTWPEVESCRSEPERHDWYLKSLDEWVFDEIMGRWAASEIPRFRELGVPVPSWAKLGDFADAIASKASVIILFTHRTDEGLFEFRDGLFSADDIVAAVPSDFTGLLDLVICLPDAQLPFDVRKKCPGCMVRYQDILVRANFWLPLFTVVFSLLKNGRRSYPDAFELGMRMLG